MKTTWFMIAVLFCVYPFVFGGNNVGTNFNKLSGFDNMGMSEFNEESGKKILKEKCKNMTNDDTILDRILEARVECQNCLRNNLNLSNIQFEIEEAKKTGDLDVVFGKYCRKVPILTQCVKEFYKTVEPCLTSTEREGAKIMFNVTQSIIDFLCYRDGDRIALFIAEGGIECIQSQQEEIQKCYKNNMGDGVIPKELSKFENQCSTLIDLQNCVVRQLEKCKEPTPANLVDALFKYVRKIAACPKRI